MADQRHTEKSIRKNERKKVKSKRRAKGTLYTMFAALIAFLISIFGGFLGLNPIGIYSDGSGSHSIVRQNDEAESVEAEPVALVEEQEGGVIQIIVEEKAYMYDGKSYDLAGITEVISNLKTNAPIELVDRLAVNLSFEEVEKVLQEEGVEYNIVEDYE